MVLVGLEIQFKALSVYMPFWRRVVFNAYLIQIDPKRMVNMHKHLRILCWHWNRLITLCSASFWHSNRNAICYRFQNIHIANFIYRYTAQQMC